MGPWELLLRLAVALALGGVIGFEREMDEQAAGFRTHKLVSLGATLFTIAGAYGFDAFTGEDVEIRVDPTRIAAQIVTGIGFLGAGAIIQEGISVRGLTTAASLWVTAAIGMAVGFGAWFAAIGATALAIFALAVLKRIGYRLIPRATRGQTRLLINARRDLEASRVVQLVEAAGVQIHGMTVADDEKGGRSIFLRVRDTGDGKLERLVATLSAQDHVRDVDWQG